jgi:hypothetical protein
MLRIAVPDPDETRLVRPRHLKERLEAEATGIPFLYWLDDDGEQHILMLPPDRAKVTVGRRESKDIALTWDHEVSRAHATLEAAGEDWILVEGDNLNGSFVNGNRINGRRRLEDKDHMYFGETRVVYREPQSDEGSQSTARALETRASIPLTETKRKVLIALCRPIVESNSATPATNPQIALEVHLSVDAVKRHMGDLFDQFELGDLPQNEKRQQLVAIVRASGLLAPHEF